MTDQTACRLTIGLKVIGGNGQEPLGEAQNRNEYALYKKRKKGIAKNKAGYTA